MNKRCTLLIRYPHSFSLSSLRVAETVSPLSLFHPFGSISLWICRGPKESFEAKSFQTIFSGRNQHRLANSITPLATIPQPLFILWYLSCFEDRIEGWKLDFSRFIILLRGRVEDGGVGIASYIERRNSDGVDSLEAIDSVLLFVIKRPLRANARRLGSVRLTYNAPLLEWMWGREGEFMGALSDTCGQYWCPINLCF